MKDCFVLRGESALEGGGFEGAEILRSAEDLLARIGAAPGKARWVAIAADVRDRGGVARRIHALDPALSVVLLGSDTTSFERSNVDREAPASGVGPQERLEMERVLRETEQRAARAEKLASVSALTAGIAHDVGTPMTAILGYAELIAKSVADEKNRKRAATIVEQVHRVSDLIETLMNLSRREERPARPVPLAAVLDKALGFYREKFKRQRIEIERHFDGTPQILGDPTSLHQVLLSLWVNALEAMPEGGTLRVALGETERGDAEILVRDSGPGLAADQCAHIFEAQLSSERPASRTALALVAARTIVEEHSGEISLTSQLGGGSEFRLRFPTLQESGSPTP